MIEQIEEVRAQLHKHIDNSLDGLLRDIRPEGAENVVATLIDALGSETPFTTGEALPFCDDFKSNHKLGHYLATLKDHNINGFFVERITKDRSGVIWQITHNRTRESGSDILTSTDN